MNVQFPTIISDRLLLREIIDTDLDHIFNGLSNPRVIKHYGVSYRTKEETKAQMDWFSDKKQLWWAICSREGGTFFGAGGLNDINTEQRKAEIGLWLLPKYWGQGIMNEAMPLITKHAFDELKLNRIEGFVESENLNCKKALSKLDFRLEKTISDQEIKNGKPISIDVYIQTM